MILGIFLTPGDSLENMSKSGQDIRFIKLYLEKYSKEFSKVYLFTYGEDRDYKLPSNVVLIPNNKKIHRLVFAILLPLLKRRYIKQCNVIRGFGLASSLSSILLSKTFTFNWAYDYIEFSKITGKYIYIPFYYILEKIALFKADIIFIATKKKYVKLKGTKYIYLPNGVDLTLFKPKKNKKKGVVFAGRFDKQKNLFMLLKAISIAPNSYRKITFIGAGPLEKELKEYAANNKVSLKIIKPVKNTRLPKILSEFSVFALTSLSEGSPKSLMEAMALGLTPVVTNFSTASEFIRDKVDGVICDFNEKIISKNISNLLSKSSFRNKVSANAVNRIRKDFDHSKLIKKEITILKSLVS